MKRTATALALLCGLAVAGGALAATESRTMPLPAAGGGPASLDPARQKNLYLGVIDSLRKEGLARAALANLDAYDLEHPRDLRAQILRADCLSDIGDYARAELIYTKLVSGPAADQAEAGLGHIFAKRGDWTQASEAFGRAVKKKPTNPAYINDLGYALVKAGKTDDGLFRLRQAAELAPNDPMIRNNLILALDETGQAVEAADRLGKIAAADERRAVETLIAANHLPAPGKKPEGETP